MFLWTANISFCIWNSAESDFGPKRWILHAIPNRCIWRNHNEWHARTGDRHSADSIHLSTPLERHEDALPVYWDLHPKVSQWWHRLSNSSDSCQRFDHHVIFKKSSKHPQ